MKIHPQDTTSPEVTSQNLKYSTLTHMENPNKNELSTKFPHRVIEITRKEVPKLGSWQQKQLEKDTKLETFLKQKEQTSDIWQGYTLVNLNGENIACKCTQLQGAFSMERKQDNYKSWRVETFYLSSTSCLGNVSHILLRDTPHSNGICFHKILHSKTSKPMFNLLRKATLNSNVL